MDGGEPGGSGSAALERERSARSGAAEDHAVGNGNRTETDHAVDAARHFTGSVETLDRFAAAGEHFSLVVDFKTAHAVVDARPEANGEERAFFVRNGVVKDHAVEFRILLGLHVAVEVVVGLLELIKRDLQIVSHGLERRIFLDDAGFTGVLIELIGHVLADDVGLGVHRGRVDQAGMADRDDGVSANLAVAGFLDETLAGGRIDHRAVADGGFNEERRDAEALFVRRGPRAELNPVHLNRVGADFLSLLNRFAGCAGLVGRGEGSGEARVVGHAHLDILREAAGSEEHALRGSDVDDLAGLFLAERVAGAGLDAFDAALVVDDELLDLRAKLRLDADFLQAFEHRENEAGAGIAFNGVGALDGMAAVVGHGLELDADLVAQPVEVFDGFIGDVAGEFRVSKTAAGLDDVCVEEVGRVLDAFGLLHVGTGSCNRTAVDDGVAAGEGHLFENEDLIRLHAALMRFERSSEAGKARADDHEFLGFIPLDGLAAFGSGGHGNHAGKAEGGGTGSAEELAAGNISHLYFSFEDRNGLPGSSRAVSGQAEALSRVIRLCRCFWVLTSL